MPNIKYMKRSKDGVNLDQPPMAQQTSEVAAVCPSRSVVHFPGPCGR